MTPRVSSSARRAAILALALPLAEQYGFAHIPRGVIISAAGIPPSRFTQLWTISKFRSDLIKLAAAEGNLCVLAQGLAARHPAALAAPIELRRRAAEAMIGVPT